jgi:tryptophan synthase alpha chain
MKSKISLAFKKCKKEKRPALITYTVAGDNTKNNSLKNYFHQIDKLN